VEVEKLSQTIHELEELILSNGDNANVIHDYQRQVNELQVSIYMFCDYLHFALICRY
jgi:hypothetical protein